MRVGEKLDLTRIRIVSGRKIEEERGKEIDDVCKGEIVIIRKEKVRAWCGRKILGVAAVEVLSKR